MKGEDFMKNNIIGQIKDTFYSKAIGLKKIENFFIYKREEDFGVAIENIYEVAIDESFSNVRIRNERLLVNNKEISLITLMSSLETHKEEFASFCMQFVDEDSTIRMQILNNPIDWWNKWKELIGNKLHNPKPYDIIAEIYTLNKLLKEKKDVEWKGPVGSTIDISTNEYYYEVKSSLVRYENEITVSSQFQLQNEFNNKILIYYKMEEMEGGHSISSILESIADKIGKDSVIFGNIEKKLEQKGYRENSSIRKKSYLIHEIREYFIDDEFPKITKESFVEGKIPANIKKIYYIVNLDNIKYKNWEIGG